MAPSSVSITTRIGADFCSPKMESQPLARRVTKPAVTDLRLMLAVPPGAAECMATIPCYPDWLASALVKVFALRRCDRGRALLLGLRCWHREWDWTRTGFVPNNSPQYR